jgi:hypothetical protein
MPKWVGINEHGMRVGETHPRAVLSDEEVDWIRELYETGLALSPGERIRRGLTLGGLAAKFEVSKSSVRDIIRCRCRAQAVAGFKRAVTGKESQ